MTTDDKRPWMIGYGEVTNWPYLYNEKYEYAYSLKFYFKRFFENPQCVHANSLIRLRPFKLEDVKLLDIAGCERNRGWPELKKMLKEAIDETYHSYSPKSHRNDASGDS